jgi:hypothetical protein
VVCLYNIDIKINIKAFGLDGIYTMGLLQHRTVLGQVRFGFWFWFGLVLVCGTAGNGAVYYVDSQPSSVDDEISHLIL